MFKSKFDQVFNVIMQEFNNYRYSEENHPKFYAMAFTSSDYNNSKTNNEIKVSRKYCK